jgi:hypothetical protein
MPPAGSEPNIQNMNATVLAEERVSTAPATARPYLLGGLAALSIGAAAIHFAVIFEHFSEYVLYGVFFLIISWAQLIWAPAVVWRPSRLWLWLGILGNAVIVVVYFASRLSGLPFGPDKGHPEAFGALDLVSIVFEVALVAGCAALLYRPDLLDRPVRRRTGFAGLVSLLAFPAAVIAVTTAVMTPAWAGPEGPAGMAASMTSLTAATAAPGAQQGMGDMGTTDGLPDMKMYGSTAPATAAQVIAAANLIKATDKTLLQYQNVNAAFKAGYTYVLTTNKGEEHLLYNGPNPAFAGLNPQHPSSLIYATNVAHHAPILLGAMYIMPGNANGPQIGGGLTRWHSHLVTCVNNKQRIVAFDVTLRGGCNPATWHNQYTSQMMHVWVVPYPGGPFSDDLSQSATNAGVRAALAHT